MYIKSVKIKHIMMKSGDTDYKQNY